MQEIDEAIYGKQEEKKYIRENWKSLSGEKISEMLKKYWGCRSAAEKAKDVFQLPLDK